jgi:hypothetical protein
MARFRTVTDQAKEELLKRLRRRHGSKLNRYLVSIGVGRNCLKRWKNGDPMSVRSFYDICDRSRLAPTRLIAKTETLSDKYDLMQQDYRDSRDPDERHGICVLAASTLYRDLCASFKRINRSILDCHRALGGYPDLLRMAKDLNGGNPVAAPPARLRMSTESQDMIWIDFKEETVGIFVVVTEVSRDGRQREVVFSEPLGLGVGGRIFGKFRNINSRRPRKSEAQKLQEEFEALNRPFWEQGRNGRKNSRAGNTNSTRWQD